MEARSVVRVVRILISVTLLASCAGGGKTRTARGGSSAPRSEDTVLVTVMSARVVPTVGQEPWDPPDEPDQTKSVLTSIGSLWALADPTSAVIFKAIEGMIPEAPPSPEAGYPDPMVRVTINEGVSSRVSTLAVIPNNLRPTWNHAFYVRLGALRESGLDLQVVDHDGENGEALIGAVSLNRSQLASAATSGEFITLDLSDRELEGLRLRVEPVHLVSAPEIRSVSLPLNSGVVDTGLRVHEGAIVTVQVRGEGRVGSGGIFGCPPDVTPAGLPGGRCTEYNLAGMPALTAAAHGSAVALLGAGSAVKALSLAQGDDPAPCTRFAAPTSGPLVFGINDRNFTNNSGEFTFKVSVEPPDAAVEHGRVPSWCTGER